MPTDPRRTRRWQTLRTQLLKDQPVCVWCRRAPATEIDHVIPIALCEDPFDTDNLVPACKPCNSTRGTQHQQRLNQAKKAARRPYTTAQPATFLDVPMGPTPPPIFCVSPNMENDLPISGGIESDAPMSGRIEPRLVTAGLGGETYGPLVATWAQRHLGVTLMDWQRLALDGQLEHDDEGDLIRREALVSVARQNGKTVALAALAGWWLTDLARLRRRPQNVFLTAHKLDRAQAIFYELEPVLKKLGGKPTRSYGRSSMAMPDGSQLLIRAATPTNAHGGTNDLIIVDELWSVQPTVVFDALRPSQIARQSPLMSMWSTAGDQTSTVMLQIREQAINAIDADRFSRTYFAEWSPPPGVSLSDRQWWAWANPALGTTITEDALEAAADTPDTSAFLRAHLNVWVAAAESWLPIGTWDAATVDSIPSGGVVAVDSSLDDSRYVGVRAVAENGTVYVEAMFVVDTAEAMWAELRTIATDRSIAFAITPGLHAVSPTDLRRRAVTVGMAEQYTYTPIVRSLILEGRLKHLDQANLAEHVNRGVLGRNQNSIALVTQKSPGPIELARCMVWAAGIAARPQPAVRRAMFASA